MTKEDCLDAHIYQVSNKMELHQQYQKAMDEWAKIMAVEFAKHMNNGEDDRFEARYEWFLKHGSELGK